MKKLILVCMVLLLVSVMVSGVCPKADITGDCKVNLEDFAIMASEWLTQGYPEDPEEMVWVSISESGFSGEMSKYETTNAQYCQFLNAALASGDITVGVDKKVYGANGSNSGVDFVSEIYFDLDYDIVNHKYSQIIYSEDTFSVRSRKDNSNNDIDMSNHPVVEVSWFGATAFCNYYGYRLPMELEWQAVADNTDGDPYTYGCGATIDQSKANYVESGPSNPLGLIDIPLTSPVNHYPSYGYGLNDMAGNLWEWTSTVIGSFRVFCGGGWRESGYNCTVSSRLNNFPDWTSHSIGFRVCR